METGAFAFALVVDRVDPADDFVGSALLLFGQHGDAGDRPLDPVRGLSDEPV